MVGFFVKIWFMEKIKTADGTYTYLNPEYNEAYHSTKAGAYKESLHKFILPTKVIEKAKKQKEISVLDIGFGLGYNVAVLLQKLHEEQLKPNVNIISLEKDPSVFEKIKKLPKPENLKDAYDFILSGEFKDFSIENQTFSGYVVENDRISLKVILGEARENIKKLADTKIQFDAVFWDAFSPKVNTEMWTVELFKLVKNLMKPDAILATYSASLAVRKGLIEAGFKIGLVEPIGRKSYSTVATLKGDIPPLTEKEKFRLKNSPYAVPYHDNEELNLPKDKIKENWETQLRRRLNQV